MYNEDETTTEPSLPDEENEAPAEEAKLFENLFTNAVDVFATVGNKSKSFGYVGSRESLCSCDKMNDNYTIATHISNRFLVADIRVGIPSCTLLVSFPSTTIPKARPHAPSFSSSLNNCLFLSLPKQITVTYDTVITPTSRQRTVVNVPSVVVRVLKGVDFGCRLDASLKPVDQARNKEFTRLDGIPGIGAVLSRLSLQRFLCVGELPCTVRVAL